MNKFFKEFKEFISKGNVIDMAVGIIIGGAFTTIVKSLVDDIINPILGVFGGMNFSDLSIKLLGDATLNNGNFLTAVINFLIMTFIVFIIDKTMKKLSDRVKPKKEKPEPTERDCPYCMTKNSIKAIRCPNCTSALDE